MPSINLPWAVFKNMSTVFGLRKERDAGGMLGLSCVVRLWSVSFLIAAAVASRQKLSM